MLSDYLNTGLKGSGTRSPELQALLQRRVETYRNSSGHARVSRSCFLFIRFLFDYRSSEPQNKIQMRNTRKSARPTWANGASLWHQWGGVWERPLSADLVDWLTDLSRRGWISFFMCVHESAQRMCFCLCVTASNLFFFVCDVFSGVADAGMRVLVWLAIEKRKVYIYVLTLFISNFDTTVTFSIFINPSITSLRVCFCLCVCCCT